MWAVIVAAGRGERFGGPKALVPLLRRPLLAWSVGAFLESGVVQGIVAVGREEDLPAIRALLPQDGRSQAVAGGRRRQDSVLAGVRAAGDGRLFVHDAARPLVTPELIRRVATAEGDAVVPGVPLRDTLRRDGPGGPRTVERTGLYQIQTPQAFSGPDLARRLAAAGRDVTDEAALYETGTDRLTIVPGEARNIKVTDPGDLLLAEALLRDAGAGVRVGHGYDVHPTAPGGPMRLGGVDIACDLHLVGHSDSDVLLHAVADAILGAAGLPDIGQHFPPGREETRGMDSADIVRRATALAMEAGYRLVQVDTTLVAEAPKISPHRAAIRQALAKVTGLGVDAVNVKATTEEGLGEVGRGEAVRAYAIAVLA